MNESHLSANIWMVVAETTSYSCKKCLFLINLARFVIQLCNRIEFVGYQSRRHWNNFHEIAFVEGDHQQCLPDSWSFHSVILVHLCYSQRKQRNTAKICTLSQKVTRCIRSGANGHQKVVNRRKSAVRTVYNQAYRRISHTEVIQRPEKL